MALDPKSLRPQAFYRRAGSRDRFVIAVEDNLVIYRISGVTSFNPLKMDRQEFSAWADEMVVPRS